MPDLNNEGHHHAKSQTDSYNPIIHLIAILSMSVAKAYMASDSATRPYNAADNKTVPAIFESPHPRSLKFPTLSR